MTTDLMPQYICHKKVWALKIMAIDTARFTQDASVLIPENPRYGGIGVDQAYMDKHKPEVGGYYVVYEDGYKSFSPAAAFEQGYTLWDAKDERFQTAPTHPRDPSLVYYGPHPCQKCDPSGEKHTSVVVAARGRGHVGEISYNFSQGSHYPNHVWQEHVCSETK